MSIRRFPNAWLLKVINSQAHSQESSFEWGLRICMLKSFPAFSNVLPDLVPESQMNTDRGFFSSCNGPIEGYFF